MMKLRLLTFSLFCALAATAVKAQNASMPDGTPADSLTARTAAAPESLRGVTERTWLWGVGRANVLDTYLSPLEYTGLNLHLLHRTERTARWGGGRVTVHSLYTAHGAYLSSPTDDGKEMDGELTAAGGWLYNWRPARRWRLAAGGLLEGSGGFTYNTRGSNNPAQGRLGVALAASGLAEYRFPFLHREAVARIYADAQLAGVQFSPEYGQSYYEIFSLGHSSGVVHFTQPANCPTVRLQAQVALPLFGARLTLGYLADVRQSQLGGLKRHAWRNSFVVGYTRYLRIIR